MLETLFSSEVIKKIFSIIRDSGSEIRFVGGCVRNAVLNIPVQDIDLATTCFPDDLESLLAKHDIKTINIGKDFGTIIAVVGKESYEITTLRRDVEFYNGRHAVVEYTKDWQEDAERRDFTFNAMSYCPYQDKLFDYFSGCDDLSKGLVRFIGRAEDRVKEDYLRILRFFRFYAYYGKAVDQGSLNACIENSKHLSLISAERKWQELSKILSSARYLESLELMADNGVLADLIKHDVSEKLIQTLKSVQNLSQKLKHSNSPIFILFIIAALCNIQSKQLKAVLSLSNKETSYVSNLYNCIAEIEEGNIKDDLYFYVYKWKDVLLDSLVFLYSSYSQRGLDGLYKDVQAIIKNNDMILPVSGHDIIKNFDVKDNDKRIGVLLDVGKRYWCRSAFKAAKNEIIKHIKNHEK